MEEKRFDVGGWLNAIEAENFLAYGEVYKDTVKSLITHFGKESTELLKEADESGDPDPSILPQHSLGIIPVVFLFRHYIELKLKGLILLKGGRIKGTNHDIQKLLEELKSISKTTRISKETEEIIQKLQTLDQGSDGFRYPYTIKGDRFFQKDSEFLNEINSLSRLKEVADKVMNDLTNVEGDFDAEQTERDAQREYEEDSRK